MFEFEEKYKGKIVCGIDEVGRGPLAGPVVACAIIMPMDKIVEGVDDSKKLSPKKREMLYDKILEVAIDCKLGQVDNFTIDQINILNATKLAMKNAVCDLKFKPDVLLIDAVKLDLDILQENIIKGDQRSYSIACASIIAKVFRDRLMTDLAKKYPLYQFEKHKGYGTKVHIEALKKYGECEIHRQTFIKNFKCI